MPGPGGDCLFPGGICSGGCLVLGVSAPGGVCLVPGGVPASGLGGMYIPACDGADPPVN